MRLSTDDGFVIYQIPNSNQVYIRVGDWSTYNNQKEGFIIQNFNNSTCLILQSNRKTLTSERVEIEFPQKRNETYELSKDEYKHQLNKFIEACDKKLQKVISSRIVNKAIDSKTNLYDLFKELAKNHNNAFIYIANIPKEGIWMGATPETLVKKDKNKSYTIALAGTQNKTTFKPWEEKEIQEHQFVIDDISKKLTSNRINHHIQSTETVYAGRVAHLKTKIELTSTIEDIKKVADSLHPTSAVCGMPQSEAYNFIIENEPYNREFYTGYLGELGNEESWLFVNLRCMQIFNQSIRIYVGGGITKDSIAEKEWEETQLKSQTLLDILPFKP